MIGISLDALEHSGMIHHTSQNSILFLQVGNTLYVPVEHIKPPSNLGEHENGYSYKKLNPTFLNYFWHFFNFSIVSSSTSSVCAAETKPTSKGDGAK